jgi:hypothetical protein
MAGRERIPRGMPSPVVQQDVTGCAIASAAALAGRSYTEAKRTAAALGIDLKDSRLWSDTAPMRRLLGALGVEATSGERPFRSWDALPGRALLAIKWHLERGVPHWHWVVFAREGGEAVVLDPKAELRTQVRRDFGRMKPKWFIEIRYGGGRGRRVDSR